MLEILALIMLWRKIGNVVSEKGRETIGYQLMAIGMWIGGEILGFMIGTVLTGGGSEFNIAAYGLALVGAIAGGVTAYLIARSLTPASNVA